MAKSSRYALATIIKMWQVKLEVDFFPPWQCVRVRLRVHVCVCVLGGLDADIEEGLVLQILG